MKKSILVEQPLSFPTNKLSISKSPHCINDQPLESLLTLMQILITKQQNVQTLKQMLTQRGDFNPELLFNYITAYDEEGVIDKKGLCQFLESYSITCHEEQIRLLLNSYGYKDKMGYAEFINMIMPVDTELLKYISVTAIKKYPLQNVVTQEVLFIYLMLIQEELNLLEEVQNAKLQLFPRICRKQIKNLMKTIKKEGDCKSQMEIESQNFIKYEELKNVFKKLILRYNVQNKTNKKSMAKKQPQPRYLFLEKNLSCIFRKLSMGRNSFINLEDLEFWVKPFPKQKICHSQQHSFGISNVFSISGIKQLDSLSKISLENLPLTHLDISS